MRSVCRRIRRQVCVQRSRPGCPGAVRITREGEEGLPSRGIPRGSRAIHVRSRRIHASLFYCPTLGKRARRRVHRRASSFARSPDRFAIVHFISFSHSIFLSLCRSLRVVYVSAAEITRRCEAGGYLQNVLRIFRSSENIFRIFSPPPPSSRAERILPASITERSPEYFSPEDVSRTRRCPSRASSHRRVLGKVPRARVFTGYP